MDPFLSQAPHPPKKTLPSFYIGEASRTVIMKFRFLSVNDRSKILRFFNAFSKSENHLLMKDDSIFPLDPPKN